MNLVIFVVLGRLGNNLSISKLAPICNISNVKKVYAFRQDKGFDYNEKLEYITLPKFITKIKPKALSKIIRLIYEPIQLFYFSLKLKPNFINGVYTLPKGLNSFIVSKLLGIRCVISIIGGKEEIEFDFIFPKVWKKLNLFMLKKSWAVACKGNRDIEYLVKNGIDRNKIFVFNGGIDVERFNPGIGNREFDIIFVGRFDENKGSFRMLEIINRLNEKFENIKCAFLGDGPIRMTFEAEVIRLGFENKIKAFGFVSNPESYYARSKIFVLPSSNEGLSTALLESMSCGCAPVVSDVGNMAEAVINDRTGFLIKKYDDIDAYVTHISVLLNDNTKLTQLSRNATTIVMNNYSNHGQSIFFNNIINYEP
jgi:glycosyltransferase involved in cell wall biosynthesis